MTILSTTTSCPFCKSDDITGGFVEILDEEVATQPCDCSNCEAEWIAEYTLSKVAVQSEPECGRTVSIRRQKINLQKNIRRLLDAVEEQIEQLPQKGGTAEYCQRINLLNELQALYAATNGIETTDLVEDDADAGDKDNCMAEFSVIDADSELPVAISCFYNESGDVYGIDSSFVEQVVNDDESIASYEPKLVENPLDTDAPEAILICEHEVETDTHPFSDTLKVFKEPVSGGIFAVPEHMLGANPFRPALNNPFNDGVVFINKDDATDIPF